MVRTLPQTENRLDRVFYALSDHTRRSIIARLARGTATVTEIAEPFDMSLPAVSKHLKILESADLVERKIDGRVHYCTLTARSLLEVDRWLSHFRVFWEDTLDSLAEFVERGESKRRSMEIGHGGAITSKESKEKSASN